MWKNGLSRSSSLSNKDSFMQLDDDRFTKHHPFKNLVIMSFGPFLSTAGISILDSIELMLISKRFKNNPNSYAVQIIGLSFFIFSICLDIGLFLTQAIVARSTSLIGEGRKKDGCQLITDLYRLSILVNIIASIIINFCARPLLLFSGCPEDLIEQVFLLVIVTVAPLCMTTLFHMSTGFLQANGRPVMNGLFQLAAKVLQTFIMTPILQYGIKVDVTLSNLSMSVSQSFFGLLLFILIYQGKFILKPTFDMWFNPFHPELKKALIYSLPSIPAYVYSLIPPIFILRYMTQASKTETIKTDVIAVYTIIQKMVLIGLAIPQAVSIGFLTSTTHALAVSNYKRVIDTLKYAALIIICFLVIYIPLLIFRPLWFAKLFVSQESELKMAEKMLPIPFYTFSITAMNMFCNNFFVAIGKPFISLFNSTIQLISICIASKVLLSLFPTDPAKEMFSYTACDCITLVLTLIFFIINFIPLYKKYKNSVNVYPLQSTTIVPA